MRAIRTQDYLYIRNLEPERSKLPRDSKIIWGQPLLPSERRDKFLGLRFPAFYGAFRNDPEVKPYVERAFGQRPPEELYEVNKDPFQLHNLAGDPGLAQLKSDLKTEMVAYLKKTGDPRFTGGPVKFNDYPPVTKQYREEHDAQIRADAKAMRATYEEMKQENKARANQ
jgi:hypothetical protein